MSPGSVSAWGFFPATVSMGLPLLTHICSFSKHFLHSHVFCHNIPFWEISKENIMGMNWRVQSGRTLKIHNSSLCGPSKWRFWIIYWHRNTDDVSGNRIWCLRQLSGGSRIQDEKHEITKLFQSFVFSNRGLLGNRVGDLDGLEFFLCLEPLSFFLKVLIRHCWYHCAD